MSDFDLGMISGTADFVDPAELAATTPPAAAAAAAAAALAAMVAADSGSGGDSSNEGAPGLQQDDSSSNKGPAAAAAVPLVKPKREFHHKGGGPCDHCGVLGEPWTDRAGARQLQKHACSTAKNNTLPMLAAVAGVQANVPAISMVVYLVLGCVVCGLDDCMLLS
jgi:hypothetical protein